MATKPIVGSYFSGGGIFLANVKDQVEIAFGVEYDPAIAEVYRTNISDRVIVSRVQDVDVKKLERVDFFEVSPVCIEFSVAKTGGKESAEEVSQATAICAYLDYHKPTYFLLENVRGYIKSKSFSMIVVKLTRLGYTVRYTVENAANYGVPQTRERLILRAALNCPLPSLPDYVDRWIGWYEAIEDLIPELPESEFAPWQLERLPENVFDHLLVKNQSEQPYVENPSDPSFTITTTTLGRARAFLADMFNASRDFTVRGTQEPSITIAASHMRRDSTIPKAFLMPNANASNESYYRFDDEPTFTVTASPKNNSARAFIVDGKPADNGRVLTVPNGQDPVYTITSSSDRQTSRAWLSQGRVVKMTPRSLARFMSVNDGYNLTGKNGLDCRVLGNGIPSEMGRKITEAILGLNK